MARWPRPAPPSRLTGATPARAAMRRRVIRPSPGGSAMGVRAAIGPMPVWIAPQVLLAQRVRPGPCGDFTDLPPPASAAAARVPLGQLIADAGHDSEANHRHCREGPAPTA
jgi:hypothetical protein